jgi:diketogulonate reductase-like aldo/keto reductase
MSSAEDVRLTARVPLLPPSLLVAFAEAFDNFDEAAAEEATRILFSHVFDETYFGILSMLGRLQRGHVELLLLPLPGHLTSAFLPTNSETTLSRIRALPESTKARAGLEVWRARWRAMEKLCDEGRVLSLGLADAHLKEGSGVESLGLDSEVQWAQTLLRYARIRPVVLQARFDPLTLKSREELGLSSKHSGLPSLLRWCSDEGIAVQARSLLRRAAREDYADSGVASSSLMQGGRVSGALHGSRGDGDIMSEHFDYLHVRQELAQVARTLGRDAFQVLIKWCLDVAGPALLESSSSSRHGPVPNFAVVVRSGSLHHRLLNLDVFGWDLPLQSLGSVLSRPLDVQKVENAKFSPSNDDEPRRTAAFSKSRRERENLSPPKTSLPPEAVSRHTGGGRRDVKELRASLLASKTSSVEAERQHRVDAAAATQLLEEATRRRVAAAAAEDGLRVAESEGGHSSILQNKNAPLADSERPRSSRWARWRYIAGAGAAALALAVLTTALSGMLPINSSTKLPAQPVKHGGSPRDGTPTVKPKPSRAIMRSKSMAEPRDPIPDEPDTGDLLAATDGGFFPGSNEDTDDDDDGNFFTPHHQHTPHDQRIDDPWSSSASLTFSSGNDGGCSGTNTGLSERKFSRAKSLSAISLSDSGTVVGAVGRAVVNAVTPRKGSRPLLPLALPEDLAKNKET